MDKMEYQPNLQPAVATVQPARPAILPATTLDWRQQLPTLVGTRVTLRELKVSDAPALLATMTAEEVARFISTPPDTVEGFERFIQWAQREREYGRYACFAVVPHGMTHPIGLFQLRQVAAGFTTAEWGFAIASAFWGGGYFVDAARMVVDFAIESVGVTRLEARSAVANGRGNGALRKLGAVQEGVLRRAFRKDGRQLDQALWSILAADWRQAKSVWRPEIVH
ncbi:MAG: GNAT family N-acetyltransferase [Acidobacteria bacterium]|nr:GNAT family N-acetyltransferase [Acidobacteriota bacterium]